MIEPAPALPLYTIRESPRARQVRLTVTSAEGLIVIVPRRFNLERLPGILAEKSDWIESALQWADEQRQMERRRRRTKPPQVIFLQAIGQSWDVEYRPTDGTRAIVTELKDDVLSVSGCIHDPQTAMEALRRWLSRSARRGLLPVLTRASQETGLPFAKVKIGNQRTLWASCSPAHTISLNRNMLFLPERLVRYLMVHELCHTVQLNHSRRFWSLVAAFEPDYRRLDTELKQAGRFVPAWAGWRA